MPHVGTLDVDLGLDAEALGDGEYARLVEMLMDHEYKQSEELRRFQLVRQIRPDDGGDPIDVIVDFLMPRDAEIVKNKPPLIQDFAVQRADGADLAMEFFRMVAIRGTMPKGGTNQVEIAVCSVPALLAMKGHALNGRYKQKDAYDIYYCVRNYPSGIEGLAEDCCPLLEHGSGAKGYQYINEKFEAADSHGPICVRNFVEDSKILGERNPDQWQQDAFGQVDAWLRALGLRE
jgi:hypothetical protein